MATQADIEYVEVAIANATTRRLESRLATVERMITAPNPRGDRDEMELMVEMIGAELQRRYRLPYDVREAIDYHLSHGGGRQ